MTMNRPSLTRREAVAAMTLGAVALTGQSAEPEPGGYIDAHSHVWTPDTARFPLAAGFSKEQMAPPSFTPAELWSHAKPVGVDRVVLIQMSYYGTDNSYMLECIEQSAGAFRGVAVVDAAANDLPATVRHLRAHGVRGFRIAPGSSPVDRWLEGEAMERLWRVADELAMAICPLINPSALPAVDRMQKRFPNVTVVIDHFARIGVEGTIRESELESLASLAKHRKTAVKLSAYYALGKKKAPHDDLLPMIRRMLDAFGPERLMWATDCPYQVQPPHAYAESLSLIRDRADFLSSSDKAWILRRAAERIFFSS